MSDRPHRKRSHGDSDSEDDDDDADLSTRGRQFAAAQLPQESRSGSTRKRHAQAGPPHNVSDGSGGQGASVSASQQISGGTTRAHDIAGLNESVDLTEYVKQNANTLTFPEKLMLTLTHVDRYVAETGAEASEQSIGWVLEGHAFVIRDKIRFCSEWVPTFFGRAKFSSFTRKLYRWGFRKVNMLPHHIAEAAPPDAYYFGNEHFQRDKKELLAHMKSVTAAKTRTEQAQENKKRGIQGRGSSSDALAGNVPTGTGYTTAGQQQALPMGLLAQQQLQPAGPVNQAALLQVLGMINLQLQLAAAQAGTPVSAQIDPSQLLTSLMGFTAPAQQQVQQAPGMTFQQMLPQVPMVQQPSVPPTHPAMQQAPVAAPAPSMQQFPNPYVPHAAPLCSAAITAAPAQPVPQQPQPAAAPAPPPPPPQIAMAAPSFAVQSDSAEQQERLRQAIQFILATQQGGQPPPEDQQEPPQPPPPSL